MTIYSEEIKSLNDFRNNIVDLTFDYKSKVNDEEIKLLACLKELYQIPREASLTIDYDVDKNILVLTSTIKLNIHSEDGFRLMQREECRFTDLSGGFSIVEPQSTFKYVFKM